MLVLNVIYKTNGEKNAREGLVAELNENGLIEAINNEDGCIQWKLYMSVEDENEISLLEKWESDEKAAAHLNAPHMDKFRAIKGKYVADTIIERYHD